MNADTELAQGKNVADAAKESGVSHLIFSSLLNVTETSGGRLTHVPHFDAKAKIEEYIVSTGVPCTFVLPGYFMSNFVSSFRKKDDGSYTLACPVSSQAKFPLLDAPDDIGKHLAKRPHVFLNTPSNEASPQQASSSRLPSKTRQLSTANGSSLRRTTTRPNALLPSLRKLPGRRPHTCSSRQSSTSLSSLLPWPRSFWRTTSSSRIQDTTTGRA